MLRTLQAEEAGTRSAHASDLNGAVPIVCRLCTGRIGLEHEQQGELVSRGFRRECEPSSRGEERADPADATDIYTV